MGDYVIVDGDKIKFTFPPPLQIPALAAPQPIVGSGLSTACGGKAVCVEGDEAIQAIAAPVDYMSGGFVTPGKVTVQIKLTPANLTKVAKDKNGTIILKGAKFPLDIKVSVPAQQPAAPSPIPDPVAAKPGGMAEFITTNSVVKAS